MFREHGQVGDSLIFLNKFIQTALLVNYKVRKDHKHKN